MKLIIFISCILLALIAAKKESDDLRPSKVLEASIKSDTEGLKKAIDGGENIDVMNTNGWSAATFGVVNADMGFLQAAIDLGINLNLVNNDGFSPLMIAASQSDKEMVEILLEGNASPLIKTEAGDTAYSLAMDSGRKVVAFMIAEAAVLHGIEMADTKVVVEYLRHGAYVDIRNAAGYTPLIVAASIGDVDAVKDIVKMKADCNRVENDGWSALHFAAVRGDIKLAEILLKANAAPGIVALDGRTPRAIAEAAGHKDFVKIIPDVIEIDSANV